MVCELFLGMVVVFGLMIGVMDLCYMIEIVDYVYWFLLVCVKLEDLLCFYGINEWIIEVNLVELIWFYYWLV